jgi:AcrR family transcriptional regulator
MPQNATAKRTQDIPAQRKSQQRSIDTSEKILQSAIREFAAKGFEGASTRSIAAAASVQHTLVTYHFGNKEGLWRAALEHMSQARRGRLETRLHGLRGVDDSTVLYLYLDEFIRYSAETPEFAWIMSHVASHPNTQLDWLLEAHIKSGFDQAARLIESAQKAGHFVEGDPKYLYYLFIGMMTRIFMLSAEVEQVLGVSPYEPEFVQKHVETCLGFFFKKHPIESRTSSAA